MQAEGLTALRSKRSQDDVQRRLEALRSAAGDNRQNLLPFILECVKVYATLGEVSDALRSVFGEHKETVVI
jgi:methylmalonyl-CoA mutase N-terminal domain/subunit